MLRITIESCQLLPSKSPNHMKSVMWIMCWVISFSTAVALVKYIGHGVPTYVKVFMRSFFGLIFVLSFAIPQGSRDFKTTQFNAHLVRSLLILLSMVCTYYAYAHLPLAFATSLGFTSPLMTTLLAILILKEKVNFGRWLALIVGYIGVLVMVRPGIIAFDYAVGIELLANLLASAATIVTKRMTKTESTMTMLIYTNIISVIVMAVLAIIDWQEPSMYQVYLLIALGAFGIMSQFSKIQAYQYGQPSFLAPFEYLRLVCSIPIGLYLFEEHLDLWSWVGSFMIICTTLFITYNENQTTKKI